MQPAVVVSDVHGELVRSVASFAFSSTAWAVVSRQTIAAGEQRASLRNALALLAACFVVVGLVAIWGVPMIYCAPIIMTVLGAGNIARPDLWWQSLGGAAVTRLL